MACLHKFHDYLNLSRIKDFQSTTLIVGTFNPSWPAGNPAEWFYGRTHDQHGNQNNNFWDVLPRIYGEDSLITEGPVEWKQFCREKRIAITDLISSIEDADENNANHIRYLRTYSDKNIASRFDQHTPVDIVQLLENYPTIQNIYLTRGIGDIFWGGLWQPVMDYANHNNNIRVRQLLTPSCYAFYQHGKYNNQNPNHRLQNLSDYILFRWQQEWHPI